MISEQGRVVFLGRRREKKCRNAEIHQQTTTPSSTSTLLRVMVLAPQEYLAWMSLRQHLSDGVNSLCSAGAVDIDMAAVRHYDPGPGAIRRYGVSSRVFQPEPVRDNRDRNSSAPAGTRSASMESIQVKKQSCAIVRTKAISSVCKSGLLPCCRPRLST